jgi:hypothetical protein
MHRQALFRVRAEVEPDRDGFRLVGKSRTLTHTL